MPRPTATAQPTYGAIRPDEIAPIVPLWQVGSVRKRIGRHHAHRDTAGYPAASATGSPRHGNDATVLNTQQSAHRPAIPDGTGQAQHQRNDTYAYTRCILDLNDLRPGRSAAKRGECRVATALKTRRASQPPVKRVAEARPAAGGSSKPAA